MSAENPFHQNRPHTHPEDASYELSPEEITATKAHFERSQEDGLTDTQRSTLESFEKDFENSEWYKGFKTAIEDINEKLGGISHMQAGTPQKLDAVEALRTQYEEKLNGPVGNPVLFWNSFQGDLVAEAARKNPRFVEAKKKLDTLEEEKERALKKLLELSLQARTEFRAHEAA